MEKTSLLNSKYNADIVCTWKTFAVTKITDYFGLLQERCIEMLRSTVRRPKQVLFSLRALCIKTGDPSANIVFMTPNRANGFRPFSLQSHQTCGHSFALKRAAVSSLRQQSATNVYVQCWHLIVKLKQCNLNTDHAWGCFPKCIQQCQVKYVRYF